MPPIWLQYHIEISEIYSESWFRGSVIPSESGLSSDRIAYYIWNPCTNVKDDLFKQSMLLNSFVTNVALPPLSLLPIGIFHSMSRLWLQLCYSIYVILVPCAKAHSGNSPLQLYGMEIYKPIESHHINNDLIVCSCPETSFHWIGLYCHYCLLGGITLCKLPNSSMHFSIYRQQNHH